MSFTLTDRRIIDDDDFATGSDGNVYLLARGRLQVCLQQHRKPSDQDSTEDCAALMAHLKLHEAEFSPISLQCLLVNPSPEDQLLLARVVGSYWYGSEVEVLVSEAGYVVGIKNLYKTDIIFILPEPQAITRRTP